MSDHLGLKMIPGLVSPKTDHLISVLLIFTSEEFITAIASPVPSSPSLPSLTRVYRPYSTEIPLHQDHTICRQMM
jgi:hypothetical protein